MEMPRRTLSVFVLFALLLAVASFPNQWNFRTYALDLGLYSHVAYDYAHGELDDSSLFLEESQSILADHFDLHLALWSPLTYLFGNWTLLLIQWLAIVLGALGVYKLAKALFSEQAAFFSLLVFCTSWGVYAAVCFDFHSSVVAAMAVPWLLLAALNKRHRNFWILLIFILLAKENEGFWMAFLCLGAWLLFRQLGHERRQLLLGSAVSFAASLLIVGYLMPSFSANGSYAHFDYSILGSGLSDLAQALTRPGELLRAFVQVDGEWDPIKIESLLIFLIAGGWACVSNPRYLLMLAPIFVFKLWNDKEQLWGLNGHYSVELVPIIALALAHMYQRMAKKWVAFAVVLASVVCTVHVMDGSQQYQDRGRTRFYQGIHYGRTWSTAASYEALRLIPDEAAVSAQSPFVPHLAMRKHIFQFPIVGNADYILLNPLDETYPLTEAAFRLKLKELNANRNWNLIYSSGSALLFERAR